MPEGVKLSGEEIFNIGKANTSPFNNYENVWEKHQLISAIPISSTGGEVKIFEIQK